MYTGHLVDGPAVKASHRVGGEQQGGSGAFCRPPMSLRCVPASGVRPRNQRAFTWLALRGYRQNMAANTRSPTTTRVRSLEERNRELALRLTQLRNEIPLSATDVERANRGAEAASRANREAHIQAGDILRMAAAAYRAAAQHSQHDGDIHRAAQHRVAASAAEESAEAHYLMADIARPSVDLGQAVAAASAAAR